MFEFQLVDIFINNTHIKYIPINKMLGNNMYEHNSGKTKLEFEKNDLSLMQEKLAADTQKSDENKRNSRVRIIYS